ncbi:unnamed protein product [Nesidiocoris tenuis]|uniref:Uncharacterized protein n=1 Tax=Nesidiocoris tenuis TaxID=355587 RepID=A0A6H5HG45_9HEMI|nr:unnamed protein product [Nesidiocoris tenuis]
MLQSIHPVRVPGLGGLRRPRVGNHASSCVIADKAVPARRRRCTVFSSNLRKKTATGGWSVSVIAKYSPIECYLVLHVACTCRSTALVIPTPRTIVFPKDNDKLGIKSLRPTSRTANHQRVQYDRTVQQVIQIYFAHVNRRQALMTRMSGINKDGWGTSNSTLDVVISPITDVYKFWATSFL